MIKRNLKFRLKFSGFFREFGGGCGFGRQLGKAFMGPFRDLLGAVGDLPKARLRRCCA